MPCAGTRVVKAPKENQQALNSSDSHYKELNKTIRLWLLCVLLQVQYLPQTYLGPPEPARHSSLIRAHTNAVLEMAFKAFLQATGRSQQSHLLSYSSRILICPQR